MCVWPFAIKRLDARGLGSGMNGKKSCDFQGFHSDVKANPNLLQYDAAKLGKW